MLFEDGNRGIFISPNLKDWKKTGEVTGFHECPELFELALDHNPTQRRWIMYGANGQYLVGRFNGGNFTAETQSKIPMKQGEGKFYASQTFDNMPGNPPRRVQVAWQERQLSFPLEMTLRSTKAGPRLHLQPVAEIAELFETTHHFDGLTVTPGDANALAGVRAPLLYVEAIFRPNGATTVSFEVRGKRIAYNTTTHTLRSLTGDG